MAYELINVGELPNDGTGDPVRVAFIKINNNFVETSGTAAGLSPTGPDGSLQFKVSETVGNVTISSFTGVANLALDGGNSRLNLGVNLIPLVANTISIGSASNTIGNLYLSSTALRIGNVQVTEVGNSISFSVTGSNVKPDLSLGSLSVQNSITYANSVLNSLTVTTADDTANQIVYQLPLASFNNGKFEVSSRETGSQNSQLATVSVRKNNNGTTVGHAVYGTLFAGTPVTTYDAVIAGGNMRLTVSPLANATITHTITYQINS